MSQNVLLFYMSLYKGEDRPQTNEAAIKELQKDRQTRPDCILALCSESVRTNPTVALSEAEPISTLRYFQSQFLPSAGLDPAMLKVVNVPDSLDSRSRAEALSQLIQEIHEGDSLYIDLSGGLRDTAMLLVTAARILRDLRQVQTRKVLYTELQNGRSIPHDVTDLYDLYDLVSAIDEFFATGSAHALQRYSSLKETSAEFRAVLETINNFSDHLALCQAELLPNDLKKIRKALKIPSFAELCLDGLFFDLLNQRLQDEFDVLLTDPKNSLPALVSWCAQHQLYQQALTLLNEKMPDFVCTHILLQPSETGMAYLNSQSANTNRPWTYPLFHFHFCQLVFLQDENRYPTDLRVYKNGQDALYRVANDAEVDSYLTEAVARGQLQLDASRRDTIRQAIQIYQGVLQYRNQINHAKRTDLQGLLPLTTHDIKSHLENAAALLREIASLTPIAPPQGSCLDVTVLCQGSDEPAKQ